MKTHLPDFAIEATGLLARGLLAIGLLAGFGAGLARLFFNAFRTLDGGAALARADVEGFDFAATFLALEAALAMA